MLLILLFVKVQTTKCTHFVSQTPGKVGPQTSENNILSFCIVNSFICLGSDSPEMHKAFFHKPPAEVKLNILKTAFLVFIYDQKVLISFLEIGSLVIILCSYISFKLNIFFTLLEKSEI